MSGNGQYLMIYEIIRALIKYQKLSLKQITSFKTKPNP